MEAKEALLRDLVRELNAHRVEYLVVGGHAVHRYVPAREPDEIAVWVRPDFDNVARAARAAQRFDPRATPDGLFRALYGPGGSCRLTHPATDARIDLLTGVAGEERIGGFGGARQERTLWPLGGVPANYPSLDHLTEMVKARYSERGAEAERGRVEKDFRMLCEAARLQDRHRERAHERQPQFADRSGRSADRRSPPERVRGDAPRDKEHLARLLAGRAPAPDGGEPFRRGPDDLTNAVLDLLLREFTARGVDYLLLGRQAVKQYAADTRPDRIEVWVEPTEGNARRVSEALLNMGYPPGQVGPERFTGGGLVTTVADDLSAVQVFLHPHPPGERLVGGFRAAYGEHEARDADGVPARYLSFDHLLMTLFASGTRWDDADAEALLAVRRTLFTTPQEVPLGREAPMLSIQACGGGAVGYFLATATQEYYLSEGESSLWLGGGAGKLGLSGRVEDEAFRHLFSGRMPDGRKLVQNADSEDRKPAWDLTFSLPKSASVAWAVGPPELRAAIERAHLEGVKAALGYLEETAAFSRRGHGGHVHDPASLVVAGFHHSTSRNQDPQLHTHCVVMNAAVREDGTTGSLVSLELYRAKMTAGAVYRAKTSAELRAAGIETKPELSTIGRPKGFFELAHVAAKVCAGFSSRRKEIVSALVAAGLSSAKAAALAALGTRSEKGVLGPRDELLSAWGERAEKLGFSRDDAAKLVKTLAPTDQVRVTAEALKAAKEVLNAAVSNFTERTLFRETLIRTIGKGVDPEFVAEHVRAVLDEPKEFVALGRVRGEQRFTTAELWKTEAELLTTAAALSTRAVAPLADRAVAAAIERARHGAAPGAPARELSDEQKGAVRYLTEGGGSVRVLSGYAGTGKTVTLAAVRDAYERSGFRVLGASVAAVAARGLEKGGGIKSDTVAMRLIQMERSVAGVIKHHAKQLLREALGLPTRKLFPKLAIGPKTVLVVDEAGMLGTKELAKLVAAVERGGGRLVLVGDHRQLPPIGPGGGFRAVADKHGSYELTEVGRQREEWARQKGKDIAHGQAERALREMAKRGNLSVSRSKTEALGKVIGDWAKGGVRAPERHLIMAGTNAEVRFLNRQAQFERLRRGELTGGAAEANGYQVYNGDRVVFGKNDRKTGVVNGDLGTVTAVHPSGRRIAVALDRGKETKVIDLRKYKDVSLGYALTVHRAQGATFDHTYSLLGGSMTSRELAYVMASRERESARFYALRADAGDDLYRLSRGMEVNRTLDSDLVRRLEQSQAKELAHEVAARAESAEPLTRRR